MKFRHHRGGLKESLETTIEVNSINVLSKELECDPQQINFKYAGWDERCGWDTFYVSVNGDIIGLSDSNIFE